MTVQGSSSSFLSKIQVTQTSVSQSQVINITAGTVSLLIEFHLSRLQGREQRPMPLPAKSARATDSTDVG